MNLIHRLGRLPFAMSLLVCSLQLPTASHAGAVCWADWTSQTPTSVDGSICGVGVHFSASAIFPLTQISNAPNFIDYWVPFTTYTAPPLVNNPPNIPDPPGTDLIAVPGGSGPPVVSQTITFDQPVSVVYMAIFSLGSPNAVAVATFDRPFGLLNSGPGFWGCGTTGCSLIPIGPFDIVGLEGNGLIEFTGSSNFPSPFMSISWTMPINNPWTGFQVALPITEPGTIWLAAMTSAVLILLRRVRIED